MSFTKWFRKYEKRILIIVTVLIAVSFGASGLFRVLGGVFARLASRGNDTGAGEVGSILGEPIDQEDFIPFQFRWARFPFAGKNRKEFMEETWSAYAAVRLADKLGVRVSDNEVRAFVLATPAFFEDPSDPKGRYSHERFLAVLDGCRMSQQDFEQTLREFLTVHKLQGFLLGSAVVTSAEIWQANWSYRTAAVSFPVEDFLAQVPEPGEEEVTAFYEAKKEARYREAEKIRVEVLAAPYEAFAGEVTVTDEEARAHYDTHQQEFPPPGPPEAGQDEGGESPPPVKPFEEVREEIVNLLRDERAREQADTILSEARAKLQGEAETTLAAVAKGQEGKLLASTTDFFAADEVSGVPILGDSFGVTNGFVRSLFTLDEDADALSEVGQGMEAAVLCRLLGRQPSRLLSPEEAREQVVDDLKRLQAAKEALRHADELAQELREKGLPLASREVDERGLVVETEPWFELNAPDAPAYANQLLHRRAGEVLAAEGKDAAFVVEVLESRPPAWEDFQSERQQEKAFAEMVNLRWMLPARWDAIVRREAALEVPVPKSTEEPSAEETTEPTETTLEGRPKGVGGGAEPTTEPSQGESSPGAP